MIFSFDLYFLLPFWRLIFLTPLYPLFVFISLLYLERLNLFLNGHLYSMRIKEQIRKLAAGCLKHGFEVVDRTDEVSSKHGFEVADRTDEVSNIYTIRRR